MLFFQKIILEKNFKDHYKNFIYNKILFSLLKKLFLIVNAMIQLNYLKNGKNNNLFYIKQKKINRDIFTV